MIERLDVVRVDSECITLSIVAIDDFSLWVVEAFLREILTGALRLEFMIHQRLINLLLFPVICKMVMHLGLPIEEVKEYFITVHEATGRKRLVEPCNR